MTYDEIQAAIEKQIDYVELTRLLETDLQTIADEVVQDDIENAIEFEVFFDSGEFNTRIEAQTPGDGQGYYKTPVLISFVNGDYSTQRGPQFFSTVFNIEVLGFEKDRENLRKIFETYSYLNQGHIDTNQPGLYTTTTLEFPIFSEQFNLKGMTRTQGMMRLFINYMYNGQMANDVTITIDGNDFHPQLFKTTKKRTAESAQEGTHSEIVNIYNSEITTVSGSIYYDGKASTQALLEGLVKLNEGINKEYEIKVVYNNIGDPALSTTYTMRLDGGETQLLEGGVLELTYTFVLSDPGATSSPQVI